MSKILAYIRASTDKQDVKNQRYEVMTYGQKNALHIDNFIEITMSSRKAAKERRIGELVEKLEPGDTLLTTEISRLGRSTTEVIQLINSLVERKVRVIVIKQGLDINQSDMNSKIIITLFSLFAELERDLVSLRTKEALASKKARGVKLGKPKGVVQASIYDKDRERVVELLDLGLSARKISAHLKYGTYKSLNDYINRKGLRQAAPE